jgi:hypothetical protein
MDLQPTFTVQPDRFGSSFHTIAKTLAQTGIIHQTESKTLTLRVAAPAASQRTTFEEDQGPDPFTVMGRIALDLEDHPVRLSFQCKDNKLSYETIITFVIK